ncbi:NAD(P)-dependent alcohol dehydrogenase [Lentimicrobium sp. L6]|uniref:NAD(P)-dependent alcohol dehydrogenase n=1 Tax=Lentimicrobium sp. L6 TaxID=2735916 RepID=UPI001553D2A9|nr:NAD(P)-dependent alcohol dehydrogenase [Lentimicrobium sp. L6]NPD86790.1 NAD(P)-dependent alcohol dehydrogenase [Lentimicrobium sp. L6]
MKAIEYNKYGAPEVLQMIEVEKPSPKANEVLVKIHATTVTATECNFRTGKPYMTRLFTGFSKPKLKRLGEEFSGEIIEIGNAVSQFKVGDLVFGTAGPEFGANAEYLCILEDGVLVKKPENLNFEEAAASVDGFLTALPFLRDTGKIKKGQSVLINGASGSVGAAAIQVAKYYGAIVTGVCSTSNLDLVKSIGADEVIDYTKVNFTKSGKKYNIIFDAVGKLSFSDAKKALTNEGVFLEAGIGLGIIPNVIYSSIFGKKKAKIAATGLRKSQERLKDLELLKGLMEEEIIIPVVDRTYPLEEISKAHSYVDLGHKKGNVVIRVIE